VTGELATLPSARRAVFVDIAGSTAQRTAIHHHFGTSLRHSLSVGGTHQEPQRTDEKRPGPERVPFLAPMWIRRRTQQWTAAEVDRRLAEAWRGCVVPMLEASRGWMTITQGSGVADVARVYDDFMSGRTRPERGHVLSL